MTPTVFMECPIPGYAARTMINVQGADVTIALAWDFKTPGEVLTTNQCQRQRRLYIPVGLPADQVIGIYDIDLVIAKIATLGLLEVNINFAGNGIYTLEKGGYLQEEIDDVVLHFLKRIITATNKGFVVGAVRSGGQSGVDEAAIKAAQILDIPSICYAPKYWRYRNKFSQEVVGEAFFKNRFK